VYSDYIETKKPEGLRDELEVETVIENLEHKGWTGFHQDDTGLFVYDYFIKGFLKNAGNILKDGLEVKALKSKLSDFLFVFPRKIYLGGKDRADGIIERPLRAQTAQGPRVTLARSDKLDEGTEISFEIRFLPHPAINDKLIKELLEYGQYQGLGQFRNGGYGRFEIVSYSSSPDGGMDAMPKKKGAKK
jgi:hypothetical protein